MKRIVSLLALNGALYLFIALTACENSKKVDPPEPEPGTSNKITLSIHIPKGSILTTYAGEDASVTENHIDTVYIELEQAGTIIESKKFSGDDLEIMPGTNDSIVNVSFEANTNSGQLTANVYANRNYIQKITNEISLPETDKPATLFMMSDSATLSYSGTAFFGTVHLVRNVAKLRTIISKHPNCLPADLVIDYDNIKIQAKTIPNQTTLFGPAEATGQDGFAYIDYMERTGAALRRSPEFSSAYGGQIDSLYLNENYLTNESAYNSSNTTKIKITIPTTSATEGNKSDSYEYEIYINNSFRILRNYIYTLDIKIRGHNLTPNVTIDILPWNTVTINGSALGTYLTLDKSVVEFDENGEVIVNFCSDAQAIYFDWSEFKNQINQSIIPVDIDIVSDEKGQILLDKQHCGSFGFKLNTAGEKVSGNICLTAGNITKCIVFTPDITYDAHYIVGEPPLESSATYTTAEVTDGSPWLQLSANRLYKPSEMTSSYSGTAIPIFLHLDENLSGASRTGNIYMVKADGSEHQIKITQLPALYVGKFGTTSTTQSSVIYDMELYTEQIPEEKLTQYKIDDTDIPNNSIYSGLQIISSVLDPAKYPDDYKTALHPTINYCAYKNRDKNGNGTLEVNEIDWHLPSQAQLMGMWVSYSGYWNEPTSSFPINTYWSSSANQTYLNEAQYVNFSYGNVGHYFSRERYSARCVRNNGTADNTMITSEGTAPNDYPVIDFSKGMPAGSYNENSKEFYTPGNEASARDKAIFKKLQIANTDMTGPDGETTWTFDDYDLCHALYSQQGEDGWRLPTQREMQVIWIFQEEIKSKCSSFEYLTEDYYWTSTLSSSYPDNAWTVYGAKTAPGSGNSPNQEKTRSLRMRCVREI